MTNSMGKEITSVEASIVAVGAKLRERADDGSIDWRCVTLRIRGIEVSIPMTQTELAALAPFFDREVDLVFRDQGPPF